MRARSWADTGACSTVSTRSSLRFQRRISRSPRSVTAELALRLRRYPGGDEADRPARRDRLDRAPGDRGDRRASGARAGGGDVGIAADLGTRTADADRG